MAARGHGRGGQPNKRLGYSSGYLDELDSGPTQTDETFFFKVSYAWTP